MSMFIGEALAGDGNEVAHIDLLIGSKTAQSASPSPMLLPVKARDTQTFWPC